MSPQKQQRPSRQAGCGLNAFAGLRPWTDADLQRGYFGLGSPELHHADQMPGSGIHEVLRGPHRAPGVHPNKHNQGVTDAMRTTDRELHWWHRAQEMGAGTGSVHGRSTTTGPGVVIEDLEDFEIAVAQARDAHPQWFALPPDEFVD